jgi:hypothetical protein
MKGKVKKKTSPDLAARDFSDRQPRGPDNQRL